MPLDAAHIVLNLIVHRPGREVAIHRQQLREPPHLAPVLVHVQRTKVPPERALRLVPGAGEVLAPEHDGAALRRQQRELVPLGRRQPAELQAVHLGADGRRDLRKGRAGGAQQGPLGRVGAVARVVVLEFLEGRLLAWDVVREVGCVLVLRAYY